MNKKLMLMLFCLSMVMSSCTYVKQAKDKVYSWLDWPVEETQNEEVIE